MVIFTTLFKHFIRSSGTCKNNYVLLILDGHFFKNNVVEIVNKMSTLHIYICGPDCIHAFSSWIL